MSSMKFLNFALWGNNSGVEFPTFKESYIRRNDKVNENVVRKEGAKVSAVTSVEFLGAAQKNGILVVREI